MLETSIVIADPGLPDGTDGSQIIDMPALFLVAFKMAPQAGSNPSRPECTADIGIVARFDGYVAQLANTYSPVMIQLQPDNITTCFIF